jgi:hypothetical protein
MELPGTQTELSSGFKEEIALHLFSTLVWLALITVLRWSWHWNLIGLWLGGILGTFLVDVDHLLYTLIIYPQESTSQRLKELLRRRQFKWALILLNDTQIERLRLPAHNILFQIVLVVLCFWIITSTGSLLGAGIVMGMVLHLLVDELVCLFKGQGEYLRQKLFWPLGIEVSLEAQRYFVIAMIVVFVGLSWLLI